MTHRLISCLILLVVITSSFTGCKKDPGTISPPEEPKQNNNYILKADETALLAVNDINVYVGQDGRIFIDGPFYKKLNTEVSLSSAGLWLAAAPNGNPYADLIIGGLSNYAAKWDTAYSGVFNVTPEILTNDILNWPSKYGAPVDQNGKPALHGDAMLFSCMKGIQAFPYNGMGNPVENLRITQTVYAYKTPGLSNVLFVRYELKNAGTKDINGIYAGYYTDTDIAIGNVKNSIGYDSSKAIMYTYLDPNDTKSADYYNCVSGCLFLESPFRDSRFPYPASGHRMLERNYGESGSQFGELSLREPGQILNVLKALGNDGSSMIDPVTKSPTKYAFSGNPVTGKGWLDQGTGDKRNLLCTGPFDLKASESKVITVAMITVGEKLLKDSLDKLRTQADLIRNESSIWSFPVSKQ
ncbi:MAG: hypothetical protein ACM3P0_18300 [Acidobacteriota bacterium]